MSRYKDHLPGTFFGPPNLVELLRHRAEYQPDDTAFVYLADGESEQIPVSNRELDRQARAIGAWLQSQKLSGQRALLLYPPGLEFIAAFFGCLYAGVVAVPVYPPRKNRSMLRIQAVADDCDAKVSLTAQQVLERVEPLIGETPHLQELPWQATSQLPPGMEDRWEPPDIHSDTLAFLQYTSGSTGTPKGVMLSHGNLLHNSALIAYAFEHTRSGRGVFWLPSYHDMGLIGGILQPLYVGRPNILMSPLAFLQRPYRWLSAISRFRGTTSGGPNFAYDLCVRSITPEQRDQLDLSSWEVAFNGAEPIHEETIERFCEYFEPCGFRREAFYPCYGLAEATLIVSGGYAKEPPVLQSFDSEQLQSGRAVPADQSSNRSRRLVGCGQRLPDEKIVIADPETHQECPEGTIGEIWVKGPSIAKGYWRNEEATRETFQGRLAEDGDGPFLRTGDLGFLWQGELFVTGRIKELLIFRGANVYPQDIERTAQESHERLRPNAGAAFLVNESREEQLVLVQEVERRTRDGFDAMFAAIRRAVAQEHELPLSAIVLVKPGSIPKTSSNKIQRFACRQAYLAGSLNVVASWEADGDTGSDKTSRQSRKSSPEAAETEHGHEMGEPRFSSDSAPAWQAAGDAEPLAAAWETPRDSESPAESDDGSTSQAPARALSEGEVGRIVLDEVRRVAKERASELTLDTHIAEIGLDSLERMEILASLEERFGGRFPEEILPDLETGRQVIEAVIKYLGSTPRQRHAPSAPREIPESSYRFEKFPEYLSLRERLDFLQSSGLGNPFFTVHEGITNDRTIIGGRELINFSNYNYLGMSGDPAVIRAVQTAVERYGTSVSASRLVSGQKPLHDELEAGLARFFGTEAAIVFVGGHSTNETVIGHLMGPADLILHDALSHNSIVQGCILSGARRRPFPHNDWKTADEILTRYRHEYRRVLMVIEGVYSMDGDIPDLPRFVELRKKHKVQLMVDEAHSAGTIGDTGRGIAEYYGIAPDDVDVWMGTLSKSFGSCGGYIAGVHPLIEYLKYTAPGFVFSVGVSPPNAAAALASLQLMEAEPQRVRKLHKLSALFLRLAKERGFNTGMSKDSPVVPVIIGNSLHSLLLSQALFRRGINVQPILYPAVEEKAARLRFFVTACHTEDQIRYTIDAITEELNKISPEYLATASSAGSNPSQ